MAANQKIDKSNLGYLGSEYQYRLVKSLIEEPGYFSSIYNIVEQNTFTEPILKQIVGVMKDYYQDNGHTPSYDGLGYILKQKARMTSEITELDAVLKKIKETSAEGNDIVIENATKFFKQQNLVRVARSILQMIEDGDADKYDQCVKMVEDAINVGKKDEDPFNPYDLLNEATSSEFKCPISTGISKLDEKLNGGLEKKKLGVILGPAGFGKTTMTTSFASVASTYKCENNDYQGFKCVQFVFEDDKVDIARKHIAKITQIEAKDLSIDEQTSEKVRHMMDDFEDKEMFRNNLKVIKLKTNKETVGGIRNHLKKLIHKGFRPDMVTVDYFECIAFERGYGKNTTKWDLQEETMRDLERLCEEFNIALWVTTQGNKDSFISDIVRMDQGGGSVSKVQIGHVIISIARSIEDQANNRATLALLKNRQGSSGAVFKDILFNNGTSTISCDEVEDFDNMLAYQADLEAKKKEVQDRLRSNTSYNASAGLDGNTDFEKDWTSGVSKIIKEERESSVEYYVEGEFPNPLDDGWL